MNRSSVGFSQEVRELKGERFFCISGHFLPSAHDHNWPADLVIYKSAILAEFERQIQRFGHKGTNGLVEFGNSFDELKDRRMIRGALAVLWVQVHNFGFFLFFLLSSFLRQLTT